MITQQAIIEELHATKFVERYARQFCGVADLQNYEDIVQELYTMICEIPTDTLTAAYTTGGINAVRRYVSGLITRQMRSDHSAIYKKYTRRVYRETTAANVGGFCNVADDVDLWTNTGTQANTTTPDAVN